MTMENQPFEDVSPVENGDFPYVVHVSYFWGGQICNPQEFKALLQRVC